MYDRLRETIGVLTASETTLIGDYTGVMVEDFRILRADYYLSLIGATAEKGPLILGLASGDLTGVQISECIGALPLGPDSSEPLEHSHRTVFLWDILGEKSDGSRTTVKGSNSVRWTFGDPKGWALFLYNSDTAEFTTGATLRGVVKYFGVWVV